MNFRLLSREYCWNYCEPCITRDYTEKYNQYRNIELNNFLCLTTNNRFCDDGRWTIPTNKHTIASDRNGVLAMSTFRSRTSSLCSFLISSHFYSSFYHFWSENESNWLFCSRFVEQFFFLPICHILLTTPFLLCLLFILRSLISRWLFVSDIYTPNSLAFLFLLFPIHLTIMHFPLFRPINFKCFILNCLYSSHNFFKYCKNQPLHPNSKFL